MLKKLTCLFLMLFILTGCVDETRPEEEPPITPPIEIESFEVSFYDINNNLIKIDQVKLGESANPPITPSLEGHVFLRWDSDYENIQRNMIIKPIYEPKQYVVTFEVYGGQVIDDITLDYGEKLEFIESVLEGYHFIGWYLDSHFDEFFYFNQPITEDLTLYALWELKTYTVVLHNYDLLSSLEIDFNQPLVLPEEPTREGHIFRGWYFDAKFKEPYEQIKVTNNLDVYVLWEPLDYKVEFNTLIPNLTVDSQVVEFGAIPDFPKVPDRDYYRFTGWYLDETLTQRYEFTPIERKTILYAQWEVIEGLDAYPVYFENTNMTSLLVNANDTITEPIPPTREGHTFMGWFKDVSFDEPFDFDTEIVTVTRVYAQWKIHTFTVTLSNLDLDPLVVSYNSRVNLPSPLKEGHIFQGWYYDSALTIPFEHSRIKSNLTLYPSWNVREFRVRFIGATGVEDQQIPYMQYVDYPTDPIREGYQFEGWYTSSSLQEKYTFIEPVDKELALYAKWEINTYSIQFVTDGGSTVPTITQTFNSIVRAPISPTKQGYRFIGWYEDSSLTEPYVFRRMPAQNIVVYAHWEILQFTVTFETNGGNEIATTTVDYRTDLLEFTPTKEGYIFKGWYIDENLTVPIHENLMPDLDVTIYARWEARQYTITFNTLKGSIVDPISHNLDAKINAPISPNRVGYTFDGWYTNTNFTTRYVFDKMPAEDFTLYAKWEVNQYKISLDNKGGDGLDEVYFDYDESIVLETPTKADYSFLGWYYDEEYTQPFDLNKMPAEDFTLYAKWILDAVSVTIHFNVMGGTLLSSMTQAIGTPITAPEPPTRIGYTFVGWYEDAQLTTAFEFITMPEQNKTLYAGWEINQYTLSFNSNGGSNVLSITDNFNSMVIEPDTPTKEGHTFTGWYEDAELNTAYEFSTIPAQNKTIYAGWEINQYTLSFNSNGGSNVLSVTDDYDSVVLEPDTPTRVGYTFSGWYEDALLTTIFEFTTMPAQNKTIYAGWVVNQYTLSFNSNDGSNVLSITDDYDSVVIEPDTPTRVGYTFSGWYEDEQLTTVFEFITMPAQNKTLYARWALNQSTITFETNEGSSVPPITQNYNTEINAPSTPTRLGYTFEGWYEDEDFSKEFVFDLMPAENTVLYASWALNEYTISFSSQGGSSTSSITQEYNTSVNSPIEPTREGYIFTGWFLEATLINQYEFTAMPAQNLLLYAGWRINQYTITFESRAGSSVESMTLDFDTEITLPNNPSRPGYSFTGWYIDNELTTPFDLERMPANDIVLYAHWEVE